MQPRPIAWLLMVVPLLVAPWPGAAAGHHAQAPDDVPSEMAFVWFDQLYDLVKTERITAPPASRIYGLAAITLYEAIVPGSRAHRSLVGQLNALTSVPQPARHRRYHWPTVANSALAAVIRALVPEASPAAREAIDALDHAFAVVFRYPFDNDHGLAQGRCIGHVIVDRMMFKR